jgi:hypothetical protein
MLKNRRRDYFEINLHGDASTRSLEHTRNRLQEISDMKEEWRVDRENNITLFQQPCRTLHLFGE